MSRSYWHSSKSETRTVRLAQRSCGRCCESLMMDLLQPLLWIRLHLLKFPSNAFPSNAVGQLASAGAVGVLPPPVSSSRAAVSARSGGCPLPTSAARSASGSTGLATTHGTSTRSNGKSLAPTLVNSVIVKATSSKQQITKELLSSMSQMGMAEIAPQALKGEEWLAKGIQCMTMQDYRKAAAIFRKITALPPLATPDNPPSGGFVLLHTLIQAHANLGTALDRSDLPDQALLEYMKARELVDLHYQVSPITNTVDLNIWAGCTAHAFRIISNLRSQGREVHLPEWWNDNALKELSAQVMIRSSRHTESPLMMRGRVLYSWRYGEEWPFGERTLDELREATTVFQRLAGMCTAHEATYAQSAAELTCLVRLLTQTLQPDAPIPVSLLIQHQCFIWLWCATRSLPSGVHPSGPDL